MSGVAAQQRRRIGRDDLKPFIGKKGPRGELADRLTKQATGKIIGVSEGTDGFLYACFFEAHFSGS